MWGGRPAQERRRGHSVRDGVVGGSRLGRSWRVVIRPAASESGGPPRPRPGRSPGAPEARRARVFVSLIFFEASPTPSAIPSLTSNNLLASPGLCFPGGHRLRDAGQLPGALVGPASDTPSGPRPLPARRQGSKAARVTWSPSSTESAGRAEGESGWKPRNPASIAAPGPAPAPAPGRSPHARRPPGLRSRSPAGTHAPSRDRTPLPRPRFGEVGTAAGEGKGRRAGGPGRAGSPLCAPRAVGRMVTRPNCQSSGRPPPPRRGTAGRGGGRGEGLRAAPALCRGPGLGAGHRAGGGGGQRAGGGAGGGGGCGVERGWERREAAGEGLTPAGARAPRRLHGRGRTQASRGSPGAPPPPGGAPAWAGKTLGGPGPASPLSPGRRGPSRACRPRGAQAAAGASLVRAGAGRVSRVCRGPAHPGGGQRGGGPSGGRGQARVRARAARQL